MRSPLKLLLAIVLVAVPALAALPPCGGGGCPMMSDAEGPPCHGSAVRADSCCAVDADLDRAVDFSRPADGARPACGFAFFGDTAPAPLAIDAATGPSRSTPLYTLFRSLLI